MIGTYERRQVVHYLHNDQDWIGGRVQRARRLAQWCADEGDRRRLAGLGRKLIKGIPSAEFS